LTELFSLAVLFFVGLFAGFINVMAGGGSSLTLPALLFLGLDAAVANGTNRIAILFQNIFGSLSFKNEKVSQLKVSLLMAVFTLPGAVLGALAAVRIGNHTFKIILAVVMIGIILSMVVPIKYKKDYQERIEKIPWLIYPVMFLIGFYGGFIQVGVGFILLASIHFILKVNLVYANMHKIMVVLIYTIPVILVFLFTDNINWKYGLTLATGNSLGAWWSAKIAVRKGEKIVRVILIVTIFIIALKLLGIF